MDQQPVGRNDLCPCGSGKKYKKCCLPKHLADREEIRFVPLTDRWLPALDYVKAAGYSPVGLDRLILELLNVMGSELNKLTGWMETEIAPILSEVMSLARGFFVDCLQCPNACLADPQKKVNFKSLIDKGFCPQDYPEALHKQIALNFFYIEFENSLLSFLKSQLLERLPEQELDDVISTIHDHLIGFVVHNCSARCGDQCVLDYDRSGYCSICNFASTKMPCPKEGEISYDTIRATPAEVLRSCHRAGSAGYR